MNVLAIIPARAGSKGVPGKNFMNICGKPLITYSIESALESTLISRVLVSTDDERILNLKGKYKDVEFRERSGDLSADSSKIEDVIFNLLDDLKFDFIILLQPTAPMRTGKQIDQALNLILTNPNLNSIISVIKMDDVHPARMYYNYNNELKSLLPELETSRRQENPPVYYRNGSIYIFRTRTFLKTKKVMSPPRGMFEMSYQTWLNIDDIRDSIIAEPLVRAWKNGEIK